MRELDPNRELWLEGADGDDPLAREADISVLSGLRLGVRPTGLVLLTSEAAVTAARQQFPRVVELCRVSPTAVSSWTMDTAESGGPRYVLLSNAKGLPSDAELVSLWSPGHGPTPSSVERWKRWLVRRVPEARAWGEILEYPPCCVDRWMSVNRDATASRFDVLAATRGAAMGPYAPLFNHFLPDAFSLFHHQPCSYRCEATRVIASRFLERLEERRRGFAGRVLERLRGLTLAFEHGAYLHFAADDVVPSGSGGVVARGARLAQWGPRSPELGAIAEAVGTDASDVTVQGDLVRVGAAAIPAERLGRVLPFWFSETGA